MSRPVPTSPEIPTQEGSAWRGWLLVVLAATTWGTTGTASRLLAMHAGAQPLLVGFVRMAVAAPALLLAAHRSCRPIGRLQPAAILAGLCMAGYQVCFFSAVPRAGVGPTALLAICSAPIMIAGLSAIALGERIDRGTLAALLGGVTGTALLVAGGGSHVGRQLPVGALLALGAGLAYALYVVITKQALATARAQSLAALTFTVAAVILIPVLPFGGASLSPIEAGWPLFLYLGLVPTALAYTLYTRGLAHTTATRAGIASLLEPLTATLLGVMVFGERLGPVGLLGAATLLGALALLTLRRSPSELPQPEIPPSLPTAPAPPAPSPSPRP